MEARSVQFRNVSAIERHAQALEDPVARLRYLRHATGGDRAYHSRKPWIPVLAIAMGMIAMRSDAVNRKPAVLKGVQAKPSHPAEIPNVWPIEQTSDHDLYSNGLRIENGLAVAHAPRSYRLISRGDLALGPQRSQPAGIVFHITESDQIPFEPEHTTTLKRIGQELLLYVRAKRAYHFVIDRFGRVHRIVVETDSANHAGRSVWADSKWSYLDLNQSFIGVAFEAHTQPGEAVATTAQIRSAKALTEMLRSKYDLAAENCVVHAQVSVNPSNWRIGWHTDWGTGFPFHEIGLPDNYAIPNPSVYMFGFESDSAYANATGPDLQKALKEAEERIRETAAEHGLSLPAYRKILQERYLNALSASQEQNADEEKPHESN